MARKSSKARKTVDKILARDLLEKMIQAKDREEQGTRCGDSAATMDGWTDYLLARDALRALLSVE